jgi:NhaP-type Na+/H+ or K+/H+ antiporter
MELTNILLFLILVTLAAYTFIPWKTTKKGLEKPSLKKIIIFWAYCFVVLSFVVYLFTLI